ncbi:hypothetical protein RMATCC62417_17649 [Rhizopus microsporus]|nr:hypothetical protein RMATCC62417_17649 [Rhizopus microsporus]
MLTHGHACCLVLGLDVDPENEVIAIEQMKAMKMVPFYRSDPDDPAAVAAVVQRRNPMKYKVYPSGVTTTATERGEPEEQESSEESEEERSTVYMTKASALAFLKEIMFIEKPYNCEYYIHVFVDSSYLRKILVKRFGEVKATARQIERWVSSDGLWGKKKSKRIENASVEGRLLWVMNDENIGMKTISKTGVIGKLTVYLYIEASFNVNITRQYKLHLKSNVMTTIGYVRKSKSAESHMTRCRLINKMIKTQRDKNLCTKVYVSPHSNAEDMFYQRDKDVNCLLLEQLKNCDGSIQDLIHRLERKFSKTRLVVLDYAGLSTNVDDIKSFLRKHSQIHELVVDCGNKYDIFSRHELLNQREAIDHFNNCRKGNVKRSLI